MKTKRFIAVIAATFALLATGVASAADHTINAEVRVYKPDMLYIAPGDTVNFINMTSHNAVSYIKPEGSAGFGESGKFPGGSLSVTPDKEGIYGFVCEPHIGFGMAGVIVVGNVTQAMKDAALKDAMDNLKGPFRRLIGKIKQVKVQ